VPGVLFPIKEGYMSRVLAVLDSETHIGWWRWNEPPPKIDCIRQIKMTPTRGMSCSGDFEQHWRRSGLMRTIQKARNRCNGFELRTHTPNGAEWTIRSWDAKWRPRRMGESPDVAERLAVARHLEERGLHHTLLLFDGDEPVAGVTLISDRNDAVPYINYRNPEYDRHSVMNRLEELMFYWAKERGFTKIDMGGSHDYKERWAPEDGAKWEFTVCSEYVLRERRISAFAGNSICELREIRSSFVRSGRLLPPSRRDAQKPCDSDHRR
jgi:hypothetical protein